MEQNTHEMPQTPSDQKTVEQLQQSLFEQAKADERRKFAKLYPHIAKLPILRVAYGYVKAKGGEAGVDGLTFEAIEGLGLDLFLEQLSEELSGNRYMPSPLRQLPKTDDPASLIPVPTVKDRTVQMAGLMMLAPIFEADWQADERYEAQNYRIKITESFIKRKGEEKAAESMRQYFLTFPQSSLMSHLLSRITDRKLLKLLKAWMIVPTIMRDKQNGGMRYKRKKRIDIGIPQMAEFAPFVVMMKRKGK